MTDRFDPLVSLAYMPEGAKFGGFKSFIIGKAEVGHSWVEDRAAAENYAIYFRRSLHQRLSRTNVFESVSLDSDPAVLQGLPQPALLLEAKITKFDFGAGWKRYFGWFVMLESGASDFQIEGRVTELATRKLVLEFVDRRRYLGNTAFGPAPRTFNKDFVMRSTVLETAGCLVKFIQDAYNGLPPQSDRKKQRGSTLTD
jgi:hypothetical protein